MASIDELDFSFPFAPYKIQLDFMHTLYHTISSSKIGIFESPTGTGKSLSILCSSLRWLRDDDERRREEVAKLLAREPPASEEWWEEVEAKRRLDEEKYCVRKEGERRERQDKRLEEAKKRKAKEERRCLVASEKRKATSEGGENEDAKERDGFDEFAPTEYESDAEQAEGYGSCTEEDVGDVPIRKIFYASRTHSQLAQFVREVAKTSFASTVRVVTLGSRQTMCVNAAVKKLESLSLINDRCLELQRSSGAKKARGEQAGRKCSCPFYQVTKCKDLSDELLVDVRDIEEIVELAQGREACSYYATRYAVPLAELVLLPYNILLSKSARESCGIDLRGNVVIVDEAHNLLDTIAAIHSAELGLTQLRAAKDQLERYEARYRERLKAKNLFYVKQLRRVVEALMRCVEGREVKVLRINEFLFETKLDDVNVFKVLNYLRKSELPKKLRGFAAFVAEKGEEEEKEKKVTPTTLDALTSFLSEISSTGAGVKTPAKSAKKASAKKTIAPAPPAKTLNANASSQASPLISVQTFLECLTNDAKDGRVFVYAGTKLKFLLLNPASSFREVVQEARSIVLAGGTMEPVGELIDQLLRPCGVVDERIERFACGHIIPDDHLLAEVIAKGPSGVDFDFTLENRTKNSSQLVAELGRLLVNLVNVVPAGIVVFFPSYDYEETVLEQLRTTGVLEKLERKKKLFREPRGVADGSLQQTLTDYARNIREVGGAVLFAVVGGKMSEGINFADDLARCVLLVGMPYPNSASPELREKMAYLNAMVDAAAGKQYYENLCMKAVNQSIGRAIRHSRDYAAILLVDRRFARPSVQAKLPGWIRGSMVTDDTFGTCVGKLAKFFAQKKE